MKQKVKQLIHHPLIYGSGIVITGTLIANVFNFLFNLFMSRNLSISEYGILASIVSVIGLPGVAANAIVPIVVSFAGEYFAKGQTDMLRGLYLKITKIVLIIGVIFFACFWFFIPEIKTFFHIQNPAILFVTDTVIFLTFLAIINNGFLQAKMAFIFMVFLAVLTTIIKLFAGILFTFIGLSALGGALAILISTFIPYLISFLSIKFVFDKKISNPHINTRSLFAYGLPSILTYLGVNALISTDIMLVKHFFDAKSAGMYAGLSLVGRIIFFVSAPIANVMFPVIVQKYNKGQNYTNTFFLSLFLVLMPSICLTFFYAIFPKFTILFFLKNPEYLSIQPLLIYFALFITCFSLLSIISSFYLSIKRTNIVYPIMLGAVAQVLLIIYWHNSFMQIITISISITLLLLLYLLLYYVYIKKSPLNAKKK
jgi:O-antigen/teichoic acid export membrane protein